VLFVSDWKQSASSDSGMSRCFFQSRGHLLQPALQTVLASWHAIMQSIISQDVLLGSRMF